MALIRFLKTIQVGENSSQVPKHFKTRRTLEKGTKTAKFTSRLLPHAPHHMG